MTNKDNIRWVALQPLTGGMYLGFENIIGHPAECIISYKGLAGTDGYHHTGNETHLMSYLSSVRRSVQRYEFSHGMFEMPDTMPDFHLEDIDIVCAVPVCSGLSMLTTSDSTAKDCKNNNMKFLAKFALETIRPKAYIFENAPGLFSDKGKDIRDWMTQLAIDNNYSIAFYRTDTLLHYNCQRRPRTFVIMLRCDDILKKMPEHYPWEHEQRAIKDILSSIPETATRQDVLPQNIYENDVLISYAKDRFGNDWRKLFTGNVMNILIRTGKTEDLYAWCMTTDKVRKDYCQRMMRHIIHVRECIEKGHGWWSSYPRHYETSFPAIQSRTIFSTIHPYEDRLLSERELLTLMGMPYDFELQGSLMSCGRQIGQNVPVKTAEWIANTAISLLDRNDGEEYDGLSQFETYIDNVNKKVS